MLQNLYPIIESIASTSSRKEKESILESLHTNPLCDEAKAMFMWTYDPLVNFYVEDLTDLPQPINKHNFTHYTELLSALNNRDITGDEAKQAISDYLSTLSAEESELVKRIIKRDLRAGISTKTINKVFPKLIKETPYMRCSNLSKKTLSKITYPCVSQVKADGTYVNIIVEQNKVSYVSRSGNELKFNNDIRDLQLIENASGYVIMGEALVKDGNGGILNRQEGNGYINSDDVDPTRITFEVWDIVTVEEFYNGVGSLPYIERLPKIEKVAYKVSDINLVETVTCNSFTDIENHFKLCRSKGFEGTVIKNHGGFFKDGTSTNQFKVKVVAECDILIVGWNEGEGKYAGKVGSVMLQSSDGIVEVDTSGFTDEMRDFLSINIDFLIATESIMAIKFNDILKKEDSDTLSLFLPRFVEVRSDKNGRDNADSYERIKEILENFELVV
jgi:DNA ligase-1